MDLHKSTRSPITAQVITLLSYICRIEAEIRGTSAKHRFLTRQEKSRPIMEELKALLDDTLPRVPQILDLAGHIRYAQGHWRGLNLFLEDGRVEVDNNIIERQMRRLESDAAIVCSPATKAEPIRGRCSLPCFRQQS